MWYKAGTGIYYNLDKYINIKQIDNRIVAQTITEHEQTIETFKDTIRAHKFMDALRFLFTKYMDVYDYSDVMREYSCLKGD